jgi:hypothetical protein
MPEVLPNIGLPPQAGAGRQTNRDHPPRTRGAPGETNGGGTIAGGTPTVGDGGNCEETNHTGR